MIMEINDSFNELMADTIVKKQLSNINNEDIDIIPCNTGVLIKFYDSNPYRSKIETEDGFIFGIQSSQKYVSDQTGEVESNEEYTACAKVIAVGPKCQNVQVGEDVFVIKGIAQPVPIRKLGYYNISEQNILCRIVPKKDRVKRKLWKWIMRTRI